MVRNEQRNIVPCILQQRWRFNMQISDLRQPNVRKDHVQFVPFTLNLFRNHLVTRACRTILCIYVALACNGTWALEQPSGSALEFYPAFRRLLQVQVDLHGLQSTGSECEPSCCTRVIVPKCECSILGIIKTSWWMGAYSAPTMKRHYKALLLQQLYIHPPVGQGPADRMEEFEGCDNQALH